jgi:hypothetical protein
LASEVQRIAEAAWEIVRDPRSSRIERLEALKLIAGCKGVLLPDINERWLSVRQVAQLRRVRQELVEKALRRKAARRKQNARAYIRRRLRELEQPQAALITQEEHGPTATTN